MVSDSSDFVHLVHGRHLVKRVVAVEPRHRSSASIHSIDDYDELGGAGGIDTTTHSVAFEDMGGRV